MKMAGLATIISLLVFTVSNSYANETSVKVTSEGDASATVNVQNSFNSTNSNTSESTSNTKIRIESDGEVKEYESTNGEDVHIESSNGNSSVTIKNGSQNVNQNTDGKQKLEAPEGVEFENGIDETEKELNKAQDEQKSFFEKVKEFIENFFKNLF